MNTQELIIITTFCQQYEVEVHFINQLEFHGIIQTLRYNNEQYLPVDQIVILEKAIRLQKDLQINTEGIDVVFELLEKIETLNKNVDDLKNRLNLYE